MWEQNETGLKGEFSEDVGPTIFWWCRRLIDDPELAVGMVNEGDSLAVGGSDRPASTEEVDLLIGIDPATAMQGQMEIEQAGVRTGLQDGALFELGFGASVIRGETSGAAKGAVLAGQFGGEQFLSVRVISDFFEGQKRNETFLEGAKAAFNFALGLRAGGDQMGDPQRGEGALEFGTGIPSLGGGIMTKQGQAIGVKRQRQAVVREAVAEVLKMVPSGVRGDKGACHEFAGVIIHCQQEGLLIGCRPPLMNRGVVLPKLTQPGAFPAAAGLGDGRGCLDQPWKVLAGIGGDGFAVALESKTGGQFIRHKLIVGRSLKRQEGLQKSLNFGRPDGVMVAAGELERKGCGTLQPGGAQTKQMRATDA